MEEWKEYKASEFCESVTDGTHDSPKSKDKGFYLITSKHLKDSYIDFASAKFISREDYQKVIQRSKVEQYDVLFSMIGTIGNTLRVTSPKIEFAVKNMGIFKFGGNNLNSKWFYYWLKSPKAKEYIKSRLSGSTQSYLTLNSLRDFPVLCPDNKTKKDIISILSSLDDKIELNRRINENLEQQAQALFKSWFVDFEPFKGGKFVDSELGMIPEELIISRIGDIPHTIESGRRPKGGAVLKGVPSIGAENIKGLGYYDYSKTKYIPEDFALTTNRGKVYGYELLIYKDGGKPGYFIPNYTIFGEGFPFDEMYINEHVFRLDFMSKEYNVFAYFYMQTPYIMNQLNSIGGKAAIPGINTKDVESLPIFNGDNKKIQEFGNLVLPMITTILRNCRENARLAQLRDTLLPRLMSGELAITDVDDRSIFQ
ncbi:restriction endonuclease subunit S [Mediterranea massiliensis]|nr:restriction endonuclease subunit S [Mediterranea massiliensis]